MKSLYECQVEHYIYRCKSCAENIYGTRPPSSAYADRVAHLLLSTAATESHFVYRRQMVFSWDSNRGAWGLWQTEQGSVEDGIKYLDMHPEMRQRAAVWLYQQKNAAASILHAANIEHILLLISGWDRLGCLFARLHYIRFPEAVPHGLEAQAAYWKKYYNTRLGKGQPSDYIGNWHRHVQLYT